MSLTREVVLRMRGDPRVRSFEELYELLDDHKPHQFCIHLNYGIVSRRTIRLSKNGRMKITSHVDGSLFYVSKRDLEEKVNNIDEAIRKGAFYFESMGDIE
ncbi:hypothetical protein KKE60_07830 [Patescibacteria group bacterium]|nr:hypothetical protein [Patescibacteria group bacterium]